MRLRSVLPILLVLVFTGCRTYGGHGSEPASLAEINDMIGWVSDEQERLQTDIMAVEAAALPESGQVAQALRGLDERLAELGADWTTMVAGLDESSAQRTLHRALSSMISERQMHENSYARISDIIVQRGPIHAARYQVVPAFYERIASRLDAGRIRDLASNR